MVWSILVAISSVIAGLAPAAPGSGLLAPALTAPRPVRAPAIAIQAAAGDGGPCAATDASAAPAWLTTDAPAGAAVSLLADTVVEQGTEGERVITAGSIRLDPGTSSRSRVAPGPLLFVAQSGTITLYIEGSPTVLGAGEGAGVEPGQLYLVENESTEAATLLRLAVAPPDDGTVAVADFVPAPTTGSDAALDADLLVRTPLLASPAPAARLFLACLRWPEVADIAGPHSHPGPVGLWVVEGSLSVDERRTLPTAGCAVFGTGEAHLTGPAEASTAALLFGMVADGQPFWQPGGAPPDLAAQNDLVCGDPPPA